MRFLGMRKIEDSVYEPVYAKATPADPFEDIGVLPPDARSLREVTRWQKAQERSAKRDISAHTKATRRG